MKALERELALLVPVERGLVPARDELEPDRPVLARKDGLADQPERRFLRLREGVKGAAMILLAALVTVLLFAYLLAALLRPEWF